MPSLSFTLILSLLRIWNPLKSGSSNFESVTHSSVDVPFTEGPVNLSWPQIMKTITDDPKAFFEEAGGWSFLRPDGDVCYLFPSL
jgi:hypothetical protein